MFGFISIVCFVGDPTVGFIALCFAVVAGLIGRWLDSYRRVAVLFYELDEHVGRDYEEMTKAFDFLVICQGKWHIEAGGAVTDLTTWKRNAGAAHIVQRKTTSLKYGAPQFIKTNINPPFIKVGRQAIYFVPDAAFVEDKKKFGAILYQNLRIRCEDSPFIEEERVPSDAEIITHTWLHPNKSGGPDRRFANNRQIPVCRYSAMHLSSASGLNELVQFSRPDVAVSFASALRKLPKNYAASQQQHRSAPAGLR